MITRRVTLTLDHLYYGEQTLRRRMLDLDKRLKRTSYDGKPGMKDAVMKEREALRELHVLLKEQITDVAREASERVTRKDP